MEEISVLVVGDNDSDRHAITEHLTKRGIILKEAESFDACMTLLEEKPVDVVVIDIETSRMNGIEVLRQMKERHPDTEVILLAGHATIRDGIEGIKLGAYDYLTKPFAPEHLICKIDQAHKRIRNEKEKRTEAEAGYHALLQSVTDYVIAVNRNYQVIMANDRFKTAFGTNHESYCYALWKGRDEKCNDCLVEKSFEDGKSHTVETMVVKKDGSQAHMRITSTPVKNPRGKIIYVLETATDLTEKQRLQTELSRFNGNLESEIEERLRYLERSEERYRTIFERSLDAIILTDSKGTIHDLNQEAVATLGYETKEDVLKIGSAMNLFQREEELVSFRERLFRDGFIIGFEARLLGGKGEAFDAVISSNVILDTIHKITGYIVIIRDITRMKKAQKEIETQNIRLAALNAISLTVNSSLHLKDVLDRTIAKMLEIVEPDSVRIYLLDKNREYLELVAHRGLSKGFIEKGHVQRRGIGMGSLGKAVVTGKIEIVDNLLHIDHPYVEAIIEEGLKSTIYLPLTSIAIPVGVMCVSSHAVFKFSPDFVDFLTAVGNQIGVAIHNARLYENIKAAYQELKEAQEQVIRTEKLASLGKLSATFAHEINNPIASVLTYAKLMMKLVSRGQFSQDRIDDISRYLGTMISEMTRCGEIVNDLLAFSRRSKTDFKPHKIDQIIIKTLVLISHDLELKEIELKGKVEPRLPMVICDFRQIQQVLLNLITNAAEAMEGGGTLSISARLAERNGFAEITISDTGCGISEQDLKNIFEPFFTTKEEKKGVGLGLSVVYGIITNHKGSIEVESEIGKGTTFRVLLPIS